jgi:FkbM family methyltransferase
MPGIISPIFSTPLRHIIGLVRNPEYFTYHRLATQLRRMPRYQQFFVRMHGWRLHLPDSASFLSTYRAVFLDRIYAFAFKGCEPHILDLGANVGSSVLFFKTIFPNARVTAFEPDPIIFAYLEENVHGNGHSDVELICKAAWIENARLPFLSRGDDAGGLAPADAEGVIEVDALDLVEYLQGRRYDFIKMDIEGAENVVLPAIRPYLTDLPYLFVEHHSRMGKPQGLAELLGVLSEASFRFEIKEVWGSPQPFLERRARREGYDYQANIFAWHE